MTPLRWVAVAAFVASLACPGCALFQRGEAEYAPPFKIDCDLDKVSYQLGEAVLCTLVMTNMTDEEITLPYPNADSVEMWFGPLGTDNRFEREGRAVKQGKRRHHVQACRRRTH